MEPELIRDLALIAVSSVVGFMLGLFGDTLKHLLTARGRRKKFARALVHELKEVKIRLTILAMMIHQRHGTVEVEMLEKVRNILSEHKESTKIGTIVEYVNKLISADEGTRSLILSQSVKDPGVGLSLKTLETSYLNSNIGQVADLKENEQLAIHEFLNQLSIFNQEVERAMETHSMTFNTEGENHEILVAEVQNKHNFIASVALETVDRIIVIETVLADYQD